MWNVATVKSLVISTSLFSQAWAQWIATDTSRQEDAFGSAVLVRAIFPAPDVQGLDNAIQRIKITIQWTA